MEPSLKSSVRLREWTTRELLIVAVLGVVPSLVLIPVVFAGFVVRTALGPLGTVLYSGLFYVSGLLSLYIVRRPGASVLNGVFVGLVWVTLTPFGFAVANPAIVARFGSELPFLLTRYDRFDLPVLLAGGAAAGLLSLGVIYIPFGYQNLAFPIQAALVVGHAVSGALLSGLLAKLISDKLAATGVLAAYPIDTDRTTG